MTTAGLSRLALAASLALLALRLALASRLELAFDEAYYWTWSRVPALSFYDHPPMVAWFVRLGTRIAGDTELGVRLLGPFAVLASAWLVAGAIRDLGGDARAAALGALGLELTVAAQALGIIMTPDTPLVLFSAATLRVLARLAAGGPPALWLLAGLTGGAALLSKYSAVLIGLGILIWLLVLPGRRKALATAWPWAGAALSLGLFSPVAIWNARHGWVSFAKQGGRAAPDWAVSLKTFGDFLGGQLGLLTPVLAVVAASALVQLAAEASRIRTDRSVLLTALALPTFAGFLILSVGSDVEANWTAVALPPALAAFGLVLGARWPEPPIRRWAAWSLASAGALSAALLLVAALPGALGLPVRLDMTKRLSGHRAVAAAVAAAADRERTRTVVTLNYGVNALLAFYGRTAIAPVQVTERIRYVDQPVEPGVRAALADGALALADQGAERAFEALFAHVEPLETIERRHRGGTVERLALFKVSGFKGAL